MRKIYFLATVRIVVECDKSMSAEDVVSNLGVESIDDNLTVVQDYSFQDYEVTVKAYRLYSNGDYVAQVWNNPEDTVKHIQERPGAALIIDGVIVYYGIGITDKVIQTFLKKINENN